MTTTPRRCDATALRGSCRCARTACGLVVVDRDPGRLLDEVAQFVAVEHRQALARIEDEGNAGGGQLLRRAAASRRGRRARRCRRSRSSRAGTAVTCAVLHRARVEGGDLVVVGVGDDDRLRGVGCPSIVRTNSCRCPSACRRSQVVLRRRRRRSAITSGSPPSCCRRVGDVAGAAAELAPQGRHQERHVQDVQLLGQDLLREAAREGRDGVEGERTADQGRHGRLRVGSGIEDLDRVAADAPVAGVDSRRLQRRLAAAVRCAAAAPKSAGASTRRATSAAARRR